MGDLVQFCPRADAPIQRLPTEAVLFGESGEFIPPSVGDFPRPQFGLRPPRGEAITGAELYSVRPDDKRAQENIKRLAREARNVLDRRHICPELDRAYAAKANQLATIALILADEAKSLGHLTDVADWRSIADSAETMAAMAEAPHTEPA